jgi:anti-anti-sigma factor
MPDLQFTLEPHPQHTLIRLAGEAGFTSADVLDQQLHRVAEHRPRSVVFDLAGLSFISSLGMGALVSFRNRTVQHGGRVRLAATQPLVADAIRRANLASLFEIHPTTAAALS